MRAALDLSFATRAHSQGAYIASPAAVAQVCAIYKLGTPPSWSEREVEFEPIRAEWDGVAATVEPPTPEWYRERNR
jgi:hypothetical protein